jgi:hypothetical protein
MQGSPQPLVADEKKTVLANLKHLLSSLWRIEFVSDECVISLKSEFNSEARGTLSLNLTTSEVVTAKF